jgi:hypothetical protein
MLVCREDLTNDSIPDSEFLSEGDSIGAGVRS